MSRIIGIDLGTTNSCVLCWRGWSPCHPQQRGLAHHALGDRPVGRGRALGRPDREATSGHQRRVHGVGGQALMGRNAPDPEVGVMPNHRPMKSLRRATATPGCGSKARTIRRPSSRPSFWTR